MRHKPSKDFSFELPEGWHRDEQNFIITYFGPEGRMGSDQQLIQLQIGGILPQYHDPEAREKFLSEPGATVHRTVVGGEHNSIVLKKSSSSEISVLRDGIQYSFAHGHDSETLRAIDLVKKTTRFPTGEAASSELNRWSDPNAQAVSRMLSGKAPVAVPEITASMGQRKPTGTTRIHIISAIFPTSSIGYDMGTTPFISHEEPYVLPQYQQLRDEERFLHLADPPRRAHAATHCRRPGPACLDDQSRTPTEYLCAVSSVYLSLGAAHRETSQRPRESTEGAQADGCHRAPHRAAHSSIFKPRAGQWLFKAASCDQSQP